MALSLEVQDIKTNTCFKSKWENRNCISCLIPLVHVLEREPHLVLPPEVVDDGELNQGGEDEGRASAHPDVDGLSDKTNNLG